MAAHTFMLPNIGLIDSTLLNVANTTRDLTSGTSFLLATMGGSVGGYFTEVSLQSAGTNAACIIRFFLNNGGATTTAANNLLIREQRLIATTASETIDIPAVPVLLNEYAPAGWRLYATRSAFTAGNAGWEARTQLTEI
jgi:hypothetical protein